MKELSRTFFKLKHLLGKSSKRMHTLYLVCNKSRTSVEMDGTLKFVNYKVGGTQDPIYGFTENKYFFYFFVKILSYAHKT